MDLREIRKEWNDNLEKEEKVICFSSISEMGRWHIVTWKKGGLGKM